MANDRDQLIASLDKIKPDWLFDFATQQDLVDLVWQNKHQSYETRFANIRARVANKLITVVTAAVEAGLVMVADDATIKGAIARAKEEGVEKDYAEQLASEAFDEWEE